MTVTDFSDGREMVDVHNMRRTITNDASGATFAENQQFRDVEWSDPTSGQFIDKFFPGDVGPYGVVLDHPAAFAIVGRQTYVLDPTTFATLAQTITRTVTDIRGAIS